MTSNQIRFTNSLINESSTYLLQHAHNPVDWRAWTPEALSCAIKLDRPIMLSIGYSACHWCHVMEEESFADPDTAKLINENFIPIKVDREERPDIDDIYMTAVQLMTGRGGWPLTIFLTPQLKPFFGGTYFPKEDRQYGQQVLPGFKTVLRAVSQSWEKQRSKIEASAGEITGAINSFSAQIMRRSRDSHSGEEEADDHILSRSANNLLAQFDNKWGGFGYAPKFPQALCIQLSLRHLFALKQKHDHRQQLFLEAITATLDGMACGGIYDHLGGGFARYSTDERWLVPHFEKMLYDNALLAQTYLEAFALTGQSHWRQVACETLDFISRDLMAECGGFYCSLDADSEGEEGKFYVWSKLEIDRVLGSDSHLFCQIFSVTEDGNFEQGKNILHMRRPLAELSSSLNLSEGQLFMQAKQMKAKLFAERSKRISPIRDEKILTSWNGLAISAFVCGYKLSGEEKYLNQAKDAAYFILKNLKVNSRLKHNFVKGQANLSGYLDDYAFFVQALIDLAGVDSDPQWLKQAIELTDSTLKHFYDQKETDFFYTADDQEKLISRPKNHLDGPVPSATSVSLLNLFKLYAFTNNQTYKQCADKVLAIYKYSLAGLANQYANMSIAWDFCQSTPIVLVLVTSDNKALNKEMLFALHKNYLPNKLVVIKGNNQESCIDQRIIVLSGKDLLDKQPSVYICHGYDCQSPVNNSDDLRLRLNKFAL